MTALAIGLTLGAIAGFYGRLSDTILMRATDIMFSLPAILVALPLRSVAPAE